MRKWIQRYLGITELIDIQYQIGARIAQLSHAIIDINCQLGDTNSAIAGALQKLELDEFSEARKANSDAIGNQTLVRLWGEQAARDHTEGKPIAPKPKTPT